MSESLSPGAWVRRFGLWVAAALACATLAAGPATAGGPIGRHIAAYDPPDVTLLDTAGKAVSLSALLKDRHAVILEFFYTSCTTICGLQASALANAQEALGPDTNLVSITIDPEFDTPAHLRDYAKPFHPKPNWRMLTGGRGDIQRILTAFDARPYGDNKMFHKPYVYIRCAPDQQWLRLEGMFDGQQIVAELQQAWRHPPPPTLFGGALLKAATQWFTP